MTDQKAFIIVDIQYDFLPGGALAVPQGDLVIAPIVQFARQFECLIATQDWHPAGHKSFASSHPGKLPFDSIPWHGSTQVLWPDHCVQGSPGASLHPSILSLPLKKIIQKGVDVEVDTYSAFFDNDKRTKTGLHDFLQENGITHITIAGLASDYCVHYTVLDALHLGYQVSVFLPGCRGINQQSGDVDRCISTWKASGVDLVYA